MVTRQELREELERYASKEDLEEWGTRIVQQTRVLLESFAAEIRTWVNESDVRDRVVVLERRADSTDARLESAELRLSALERRERTTE